ncbi:hypothetical protein [Sunxiuqinia indica]|uniref:hypothetical protein n=1 Tax=Sunxiuqinia indica TaxID=2692584 RepID=UPI0013590994|nr:hypothetical protein [Sunxiuqinia indica]
MNRQSIKILIFLLFLSSHSVCQIKESNFYFTVPKGKYENTKENSLWVKTGIDNSKLVTEFENDRFIRAILEVWFDYDFEIQQKDTNELNLKFYNLNEEFQKHMNWAKEVSALKENFNCLAEFCNGTNDTLLFLTRFHIVYAILEGLDSNNNWKPIQFLYNHGFADHATVKRLRPNETLLIPFSNNLGEQRMKMRMKLQGNDTLFISNAFWGTANTSLFNYKENNEFQRSDSIVFLKESIFGGLKNYDKLDIEIMEIDE